MAAYQRLCTEFYDLDKPSAPADALAYYIGQARSADGRILEPMCGSGRFLLPMSLAGLQVDGVDSSAEMLEACRTHAREFGVDVSVFQQDLASLDLPHSYSLAFIPSGSIGLITETDELQRALSRICTHMVPSGTLLLEIMSNSLQAITPTDFEPRTVRCTDGSSITYTCSAWQSKRSDTICYSGTYTRRHGARVIETELVELVLRIYDVEQLSAELANCGFKTTTVADQSALAFLAGSGCMLVEARADA